MKRNITLNGKVDSNIKCVQQDVLKYLQSICNDSSCGKFDVVICDPPKFAPSTKDLTAARRKYRKVNMSAMRVVRSGGLLLTCSCSGAVAQSEKYFVDMLQEAAAEAGREITVLSTLGAGPDHPTHAAYPQGKYLTVVLLRID